ncbi:MAG: hypothetical protein CVV52_00315 [Spirochaetae bacterium HGW-Spirochaetae-8]|jgi:transcriptional regulator with XRE-family HTH domain|nr:MAG: hypothetical protein CVV52_00315 [Spirochaetae bacterium HGW-Spirochaetae-8]
MNKTKTFIHTYAMLLLRDRGLSQTKLAEMAGCTVTTINQILLGKRVSGPVQMVIAQALGYPTWIFLAEAAERFSHIFAQMYNHPTSRNEEEPSDENRYKNIV